MKRAVIGLLGMMVSAAGCDTPPHAHASAPDAVTLEEGAFVTAFCARVAGCCRASGLAANAAVCARGVEPAQEGHRYSAADGAACLAELSASAVEACPRGDEDAPSCRQVFQAAAGPLEPDAPCFLPTDCAAAPGEVALCQASTPLDEAQKVQRCHVLKRGHLGSPCSASRAGLAVDLTNLVQNGGELPGRAGLCDSRDGLACADSATCERLPAEGQRCLGNRCASPAHCDGTGICRAPPSLDAACDPLPDLVGAGSWCGADGYCPVAEPRCAARLPARASCLNARACASNACVDGACVAAFAGIALAAVCGP